jgi:predicted metal-dependent hydrolase
MRLTEEIADFVILHELCHLKHRNHGADFHKLLNKLCDGNEKLYSKQLRTIRTNI